MIRIIKTEEQMHTVITIDGQLSGDCRGVVETVCDQAASGGKPIHIFLRHVSTVDQAGCSLLRRLAARGVRLLGRGVYASYLVRTLSGQPVEKL